MVQSSTTSNWRNWQLRSCSVCLFIATSALILPGCSETGPPLGIVSGTVTLDGQPLEGAAIVFSPKSQAADAGSSSGKTGPDGKYSLEFGRSRKGAYLGEHSVIIEHKNHFQTDLTSTVKEGKNSIDFSLTSKRRNKNRDTGDNSQDLPAAK